MQEDIFAASHLPTQELKFRLAANMCRLYEGEIRIPDASKAVWTLVHISETEEERAALAKNKQLRLADDCSAVPKDHPCYGPHWISESTQADIDRQCKDAAAAYPHITEDKFRPCWELQTLRITCPTSPCTDMEWRLTSAIVTHCLV